MHNKLLLGTVSLILGSAPSFVTLAATAETTASTPESIEASTPQDVANVKTIKAFFQAWSEPGHGSEYIAANASLKLDKTSPRVFGPNGYLERWKRLKPGQSGSTKLHAVYAHDPVVVVRYSEIVKMRGESEQEFGGVVAAFLVKDGKIVEWTALME